MITLKDALSVVGTFAYIVFLFSYGYRETRRLAPTGSIGFDISSLGHNTYLAPAYWCFVVGLILVGIGIVALIPQSVVPPPQ
jgi:hypothetical protein